MLLSVIQILSDYITYKNHGDRHDGDETADDAALAREYVALEFVLEQIVMPSGGSKWTVNPTTPPPSTNFIDKCPDRPPPLQKK